MAKGKKEVASPATCSHNKKELGYIAWHNWAEKLEEAGVRQKQCPLCKLWLYPEEFKPKSKKQ